MGKNAVKYFTIGLCVVLYFSLFLGCRNTTDDGGGGDAISVSIMDWNWELGDDHNPGKWAPGISYINKDDNDEVPGKNAQVYKRNTPYGTTTAAFPTASLTGRYVINSINPDDPYVELEDSKDYDMTLPWPDRKYIGQSGFAGGTYPARSPEKVQVQGPDRSMIEAVRFYGATLQVGSEDANPASWVERTADNYMESCGFPGVTFSAIPPDADARKMLRDGYGYTFWVKAVKPLKLYRTSVENWDYRMMEGHDPAHWFGPERSTFAKAMNHTGMQYGDWYKIRVIYDRLNSGWNMDVPQWLYQYWDNGGTDYPGDPDPCDLVKPANHNKEHSIKISWAIQLQNNEGEAPDTGDTGYSVTKGKHEFDLYIADLRLLMYE